MRALHLILPHFPLNFLPLCPKPVPFCSFVQHLLLSSSSFSANSDEGTGADLPRKPWSPGQAGHVPMRWMGPWHPQTSGKPDMRSVFLEPPPPTLYPILYQAPHCSILCH